MKRSYFYACMFPLLFILTLFTGCNGQDESREKIQLSKEAPTFIDTPPDSQIAYFIRNIFQDKNGNLWFGTNSYGVAHYDGDSLSYCSFAQGFDGQQVTGIVEDLEKNIWFATDKGVVKYDWTSNDEGGKRFTNYTNKEYFGGHRFWSIFADSNNNIWAGSEKGIFLYDGIKWSPFDLPLFEKVTDKPIAQGTTFSISEDRDGNMWFSTDGHGVFKYDLSAEHASGNTFTQYTEEDGLISNSVFKILEDRTGDIWFTHRHGGVCRFNGEHFVDYTHHIAKDIYLTSVEYEDKEGNIWFNSHKYGIYHYDGESFTNFSKEQGLHVEAAQAIFEDKEGRLWVGGSGGLNRYDGTSQSGRQAGFINVKRNGPWK